MTSQDPISRSSSAEEAPFQEHTSAGSAAIRSWSQFNSEGNDFERQISSRNSNRVTTPKQHEEFQRMRHEFERLAGEDSVITSAKIHCLIMAQNPGIWYPRRQLERTLRHLAKIVARANHSDKQSIKSTSGSSLGSGFFEDKRCKGLDFDCFSMLMSSIDMSAMGDAAEQDMKEFVFLQENLVEACANQLVSKLMNIGTSELVTSERWNLFKRARSCAEPLISFVIILNAIMIGVATDTDWAFADHCEVVFTFVFLVELIAKWFNAGLRYYFWGPDYRWNWFDFIIVVLAIWDVIHMLTRSSDAVVSGLSVVRILRLVRFVRLVRVMRSFKELSLMVNGFVGGGRTLLWAMILLGAMVYVLAVILVQINEGVDTDVLDLELYFSNVPWSMLTVFRCFTDGFSDEDGRPILPALVRVHGPLFAIAYCIVMTLTLFGLFNLVAAIFVENTLQAAKNNDMKIAAARRREDVRVAKKVKELIGKFTYKKSHEDGSEGSSQNVLDWHKNLNTLRISRQQFDEVMEQEDVQTLLSELDLSHSERFGLFDVLDADGDGKLQLSEIVTGMLKVRGEARKSDVVAIRLAVRSLQKRMAHFEEVSINNQALMQERLDQMQNHIMVLLDPNCIGQPRVLDMQQVSLSSSSPVDRGKESNPALSSSSLVDGGKESNPEGFPRNGYSL